MIMKEKENVETLASKYTHLILNECLGGIYDSEIFKPIYDRLIEFAGAIEHHLSARINVEDGMAKLVENQQDMPPEFIKAVDDNFDELI